MGGIYKKTSVPLLPPSLDDDSDDENPAGLVRLPATAAATAPAIGADPGVVVVVLAAKRGAKARPLPRSRSMMMVPKEEGRKSPCFLFSRRGVDAKGAAGILDIEFPCRFNGLMQG